MFINGTPECRIVGLGCSSPSVGQFEQHCCARGLNRHIEILTQRLRGEHIRHILSTGVAKQSTTC